MTTLTIDPSLSCTGYAVFSAAALDSAGIIRVPDTGKGRTQWARVAAALDDLTGILQSLPADGSVTVVVETPQTVTRGKRGQRSASSLPGYGMIVGAMLAHVRAYIAAKAPGWSLVEVSATVWTKGYPSTNNDPHKTRRVRAAEYLYPSAAGKLGAETTAGNVADAILMGDWWVKHRAGAGAA